jgi:hypothetical protein
LGFHKPGFLEGKTVENEKKSGFQNKDIAFKGKEAWTLALILALLLQIRIPASPPKIAARTIDLLNDPSSALLVLDGAGDRVARRIEPYREFVEPQTTFRDPRLIPGLGSSITHPWWPWLPPHSHSSGTNDR